MIDRFPSPSLALRSWTPAADVYRTSGGWLVKVELAGVRREDVTIALSGRSLSVSGRRRDIRIESDCYCHSMEISYDSFSRRFDFPVEVNQMQVACEIRDGMLFIWLNNE